MSSGKPGLIVSVASTVLLLSPDVRAATCQRTLVAEVVALDQAFFFNRLGAVQPDGMIFALRRDVVPASGDTLAPGNVMLRQDKRPRPLVLRMNARDCLRIHFQNLLNPVPKGDQPHTRHASVHVAGMQLVTGITDDGSNVGENPSSLVPPGGTASYTLYAEREGAHMLHSAGAMTGGEGDGGQMNFGLFGAVIVEPEDSEWYRSQVTRNDLELATQRDDDGDKRHTSTGHPRLDYQARYPVGDPRAGLPILAMLKDNEIVHSDLTALITGPRAGRHRSGTFPANPVLPDRDQPFREIVAIYHDEIGAVQAFPQFFEDPVLRHTLHSVRDGFAINYGAAGAGAEVISNRLGVGPARNCVECKYEEFFLSSWAVMDPAQVVDIPANADLDGDGQPDPGAKATKVLYPDDPSNVFHTYLSDHVRLRVLHGGSKEHHIHHQHTHQWLHSPNSLDSTYVDSQDIGPGTSFTAELTYFGAGNRNLSVGDQIFHCHFYPHFAQGMWALMRVHDVFEVGTKLDADGRPLRKSRALPDGEILAGTPIPAVVPLPTRPMAPLPEADVDIVAADVDGDGHLDSGQVDIDGDGNPGYPFFIPALAGHRAPRPPLDIIDDGGLPRHRVLAGTFVEEHNRLSFDKVLVTTNAEQLPEEGTRVERAAMRFHGKGRHESTTPDGDRATFRTNGQPAQPGAPYADPCIDDEFRPLGVDGNRKPNRTYKGADIQLDMVFNKAGWHHPQSRISALWGDVEKLLDRKKPPEPLYFRANTHDCVEYRHTNLVPNVYQLDDFQVRSPTDILGKHIHLVKFDVTASDGSANGFNYEDGTFSPDEVRERINAVNAVGGLFTSTSRKEQKRLRARPHPFFGDGPGGRWLGAQTTIQRWLADDVLNTDGVDRTLRTVFTHDHFGPSTHQQTGLHTALVLEPEGSRWRHPETGEFFGGRFDGGPTSFRADILLPGRVGSHREFLLALGDFQLAYEKGGGVDGSGNPIPDPRRAINPPGRQEVGLPFLYRRPEVCPGGVAPPCPEAISAEDVGTMTVNYRNEPIALRVRNPDKNTQAEGDAGDLAGAFSSAVRREDDRLNRQPGVYPRLTAGVASRDPFTPLLRAYEDDRVELRVIVGAHEESHNVTVHGMRWLHEPSSENSGYRNSQHMGISQRFEFVSPSLPAPKRNVRFADYLYRTGAAVDDLWNGTWGIMRVYNGRRGILDDLLPLPNNPNGTARGVDNEGDFSGVCPKSAPKREYSVVAALARDVLPEQTLIYNKRPVNGGPLHDPTAIVFFRRQDFESDGRTLKRNTPVEPLILRAAAGECIEVKISNRLPKDLPDLDGFSGFPPIIDEFNANQVKPSSRVGLHPQLVEYDITTADGVDVGLNPRQTVKSGDTKTVKWFAGNVFEKKGKKVSVPIEFGAVNLYSADPMKHTNKGAVGALIIEPEGSTWQEDEHSRASATVKLRDGSGFREFVVIFQNDINLRFGENEPVPNLAEAEDPEDSGQKAVNYRTEPMWFRMGFAPDTPLAVTRTFDFSNALSNTQVGADPETPIFRARVGIPVRMRVLHPGGHGRNSAFTVHGHIWEEEPYANGSVVIAHNPESEWLPAFPGHGPTSHFDAPLKNGAGGRFGVTGDYLWRDMSSFHFDGGMWGLLRVVPRGVSLQPGQSP